MPVEHGHLVAAIEQRIGRRNASNAGADDSNMRHDPSGSRELESPRRRLKAGVGAPSVTVPESLIRQSQRSRRISPSVDTNHWCLSPDCPDVTVLVPESFRGGCSVGAENEKRFASI